MEDAKLLDRIECLAARLVDQNSMFRDRTDHVLLDQITHELSGSEPVEVRRRNSRGVSILSKEFGLHSFVIVARVVDRICASHGCSVGTLSGAPQPYGRRETLPNGTVEGIDQVPGGLKGRGRLREPGRSKHRRPSAEEHSEAPGPKPPEGFRFPSHYLHLPSDNSRKSRNGKSTNSEWLNRQVSPNNPSRESESDDTPTVPAGVLEGIEDVLEGRTADGRELDEALDL